jgi:hypothetical protein
MIATRSLRIIRWAALVLIVLLASVVAFATFGPAGNPQHQASTDGAATDTIAIPDGAPIGGPFKLLDDKGRAVAEVDYRGRWMLNFFGYTNCPDECPLTLQKMTTALDALGRWRVVSLHCSSPWIQLVIRYTGQACGISRQLRLSHRRTDRERRADRGGSPGLSCLLLTSRT